VTISLDRIGSIDRREGVHDRARASVASVAAVDDDVERCECWTIDRRARRVFRRRWGVFLRHQRGECVWRYDDDDDDDDDATMGDPR